MVRLTNLKKVNQPKLSKHISKTYTALGVTVSGAGSSIIALTKSRDHAEEVAESMANAYSKMC
uniref:GHMP kinase C-terminal domain-containing protein n=1 Tax=Ignisphaera aggregans TaxID=334771 RepID=A0A7J2U0D2_9CREN